MGVTHGPTALLRCGPCSHFLQKIPGLLVLLVLLRSVQFQPRFGTTTRRHLSQETHSPGRKEGLKMQGTLVLTTPRS